MKKLVYLAAILALCGLAKASSVYCGIDIYKEKFFTIEEGEQLKRIMPENSDWINNCIVAMKHGTMADYKTKIWLDQDDDPIRSAYVVKPNAENVILKKDRPGHFSYQTYPPEKFYTSIEDLKSNWPSGDYVLHVTFGDGHEQTWTATIPDYNTTPFPDFVTGSLSAGAGGLLSLDWSTVDGVTQYDVWVWKLKPNKGVYDSDTLDITPPQSQTTSLTGAYAGKDNYNIGVDAYSDVTSDEFGVTFDSVTDWFSFKKPFVPITNTISKFTVKPGKAGASKDSLSFTGLLDAIAADLIIAEGNNIVVDINSDSMSSPLEFQFPINSATFKKGVYSGTGPGKNSSFKFDTTTGKMTFNAKGLDLTYPITLTITIGDYEADFTVESTKSSKTLLMGAADSNSIKVTRATVKQATEPNADSLTVTGTFTIAGSYDKTNDFAVMVGAQTFTIAGSKMVTNTKKHTESCAKVLCNEGGRLTAKFDFANRTFTLTLTGVNLPPGELTFGVSVFGKYLGGTYINDRFVGTRKMKLYGCYNISDGFALNDNKNIKVVTSTSNNVDYVIKIASGPTFSMVRSSATQLALNPQPQNMPTYIAPNVYMLSDGSNGSTC